LIIWIWGWDVLQGAQAVGMGAEAQNVPAAAALFQKANDILGYDQSTLCYYVICVILVSN